jgi:hypothetical protein
MTNPGAFKLGDGKCIECGALVGLKKGFVMRRHIDPRVSPLESRVSRICPSSGTRNWSTWDVETAEKARLHWEDRT